MQSEQCDTATLTLYGSLRSRALRPLWLLREMGAPHHYVPVIQGYRIGDPQAETAPFNTTNPTFSALNPMGQVPVLVDGDLTLCESLAMTVYIARKFGGPLAPKDPTEDALTLQWAFFAQSAIEPPALAILVAIHQGDPASDQGRATIQAARAALTRPFTRLEVLLETQPWMLGERFTVADILVAECVRFAIDDDAAFADYPALTRWLSAARARPAFKTLWAERNAEPDTYA